MRLLGVGVCGKSRFRSCLSQSTLYYVVLKSIYLFVNRNDGDVASEDGDLAERSLKKVREDLEARRVTLEKRNAQTSVATDVAESSSAREVCGV